MSESFDAFRYVGYLQSRWRGIAASAGIAASDRIADDYCGSGRAALCRSYLRENIHYVLGEREQAGLRMFYTLAAALGIVPAVEELRFY